MTCKDVSTNASPSTSWAPCVEEVTYFLSWGVGGIENSLVFCWRARPAKRYTKCASGVAFLSQCGVRPSPGHGSTTCQAIYQMRQRHGFPKLVCGQSPIRIWKPHQRSDLPNVLCLARAANMASSGPGHGRPMACTVEPWRLYASVWGVRAESLKCFLTH